MKAKFVPVYNPLAIFSSSWAIGKIYYVIASATGWTTPSANNIISGRDASGTLATRYGNTNAPEASTAEFTFDVLASELAAGDYYIAYVWSDGIEYSDVTESAFTVIGGSSTPVLSGITLISIGTTYGTPRVTITFA